MAMSSIFQAFASFIPGSRLVDGGDCLQLAKYLFNPTTGLTALAGGGQSGATALNLGINYVSTVASDNDSVMLPPAVPGTFVAVCNGGGHSLQVFGQGPNMGGAAAGDTIAAHNSNTYQATATGVAQATTIMALYYCFTAGQWKQFLSA